MLTRHVATVSASLMGLAPSACGEQMADSQQMMRARGEHRGEGGETQLLPGIPNMMSLLIPSGNTVKSGAAGWTRTDRAAADVMGLNMGWRRL